MQEVGEMRFSIWMINNCQKIDKTIEFSSIINGENVRFSLLDYEHAKNLANPIGDWIEEKIVKPGSWIIARDPIPMECLYLVTTSHYTHGNSSYIRELVSLCLNIILPPPVNISFPGEYIVSAAVFNPSWDLVPRSKIVASTIINEEKLKELNCLLARFNESGKIRFPHFDEINRLASINDVLIEILALWAFIEGFWGENGKDLDLSGAFMNMLTSDRFPGSSKKDPDVQVLKRKIQSQNEKLGAKTYGELRNIIAHGSYLELEGNWSKEQWSMIYNQRDLLLHTVLYSLVEYNLKNA
jgi:hypothetical protein